MSPSRADAPPDRGRRSRRPAVVLAILVLTLPVPAAAYIDPLTGSVFLQVLAAGALGALFMIKGWWRRLITFIRRLWTRVFG